MILDKDNLFSEDQAVTATAASTNVIDLGVDRDIGNGEPIEVLVAVPVAFTGTGTLAVELQTDDVEGFASPTVIQKSGELAAADLAAGNQVFKVRVGRETQRYVRLNYVVTGTAFTAGQLTSGLILDRSNYREYPSGFAIA